MVSYFEFNPMNVFFVLKSIFYNDNNKPFVEYKSNTKLCTTNEGS